MTVPTTGWLEAVIRIGTGWTLLIEDDTGSATLTIPAGDYYWNNDGTYNSMFDELASLLQGHDALWSVALDIAEPTPSYQPTGKISFDYAGSSAVIDWPATTRGPDIRALVGVTNTQTIIAGDGPAVGSGQVKALWLPDNPHDGNYADDQTFPGTPYWNGFHRQDFRSTESMLGDMRALCGQSHYARSMRWNGNRKQRTWTGSEVVLNESFETFLTDCIYAEQPWAVPGGRILVNPGTTAGSLSPWIYKAVVGSDFKPARFQENWNGRWNIELPNLVYVHGVG